MEGNSGGWGGKFEVEEDSWYTYCEYGLSVVL